MHLEKLVVIQGKLTLQCSICRLSKYNHIKATFSTLHKRDIMEKISRIQFQSLLSVVCPAHRSFFSFYKLLFALFTFSTVGLCKGKLKCMKKIHFFASLKSFRSSSQLDFKLQVLLTLNFCFQSPQLNNSHTLSLICSSIINKILSLKKNKLKLGQQILQLF